MQVFWQHIRLIAVRIAQAVAVVASVIFCLLVMLIAASYYVMEAVPVSSAKLSQVKAGMKKDEVRSILGAPSKTYDEDAEWVYSRPFQWNCVRVYFDDNGACTLAYVDR